MAGADAVETAKPPNPSSAPQPKKGYDSLFADPVERRIFTGRGEHAVDAVDRLVAVDALEGIGERLFMGSVVRGSISSDGSDRRLERRVMSVGSVALVATPSGRPLALTLKCGLPSERLPEGSAPGRELRGGVEFVRQVRSLRRGRGRDGRNRQWLPLSTDPSGPAAPPLGQRRCRRFESST